MRFFLSYRISCRFSTEIRNLFHGTKPDRKFTADMTYGMLASQSPAPVGFIKVPLFIRLLLYIFSKIQQIGALGNYIHFTITVCGNSSCQEHHSAGTLCYLYIYPLSNFHLLPPNKFKFFCKRFSVLLPLTAHPKNAVSAS